jgi:recombination protein RecT
MEERTMSGVTKLPAPALPRENFRKIRECKDLSELFTSAEFRERIVSSVPRHMTNDRMLSVVLRAHTTSPMLLKATPQSFAGACLTATNTGLEPNSALAEAHLIPFRRTVRAKDGKPEHEVVEIQVIFGYQGLLKLASNTGRLLSVSANTVYPDADIFDWMEGSDTFLKFKRGGRRDRNENDQPGYAYFHARLTGGGESMEVWPWGDVLRIRNMSQGYRRALAAKAKAEEKNWRVPATYTEAPWVKHIDPMARKTMIRAGVKYLPKSVELSNAVRLDEVQDRRDIDYSRVIDVAGNAEDPDYTGAAASLGEGVSDDGEIGGGGEDPGTGGADPGAVFTDRRAVEKTPDQQNTTSGTEGQQEENRSPSFEHYLISEAGDWEGPFVDPVAWAQAFIHHFEAVHNRERDTYLENNAEAIEAARAFPISDQLLEVMNTERDLPDVVPLVVATRRDGKRDWADYVNTFRHVIFGWRGDMMVWLDAQREAMDAAPIATRLLLVKAVTERCTQLSVLMPVWVSDLAKPKAKPDPAQPNTVTEHADDRWINSTATYIASLPTRKAVEDYAKSNAVQTVMRRLRKDDPARFAKAEGMFTEQLSALPQPSERATSKDEPLLDEEGNGEGPV